MSETINIKAREDRIKRKKVKMIENSILDIFIEQKLTINECREALKATETTIERVVGNAIVQYND